MATIPAHLVDPADPASVAAAFTDAGTATLARLADEARQLLADDAVTFHPRGDALGGDRWRLDPTPLVLSHEEWAVLEAGITQRAALFDLVLADVYGPRQLVRDGVLPPELLDAHPGFLRPLDGVRSAGSHQLSLCATDLLRDDEGRWRPVADRTDVPVGAAYALENRSVLARLLPDVLREARVERLAPWVRALRATTRATGPAGVAEPRVVVLSAGARSGTAFEDAQLAAALGLPLVEGADLSVRDTRVWLRTLGEDPTPVDVLLRRVDAWWCDPLELRSDSRLGPPGLVEAVRRGGVALVNHLGAGVLENPGLHAYLPQLARRLLGQELLLAPPRTWWCGDPAQRREAFARLDELVVRPIARTGDGGGPVDVVTTSDLQRAELRARIEAHPHRFVAQEHVDGPPVACIGPGGEAVDGRVLLRTFTVAADGRRTAMRGGLALASTADRLPVPGTGTSWSKDAWVLAASDEPSEGFWLQPGPVVTPDAPESVLPARTADDLLWLGRHAERAEALVRILRAIDERRGEQTAAAPALGEVVERLLGAVLAVTGSPPPTPDLDVDEVLHRLVTDAGRPGTLAAAVARLVAAAQAVRDQLSGDTWPVITALERNVLGREGALPLTVEAARGTAAGRPALGPVLTALLALQGLEAESLVRDPTWRFLEVGRRLERATQLLALLRATVTRLGDAGPAVTSLLLESVLVSAESVITYRRRYRSRAQLATVLELLLLDDTNPRSLRWQLDRLDELLPALELPRQAGRTTSAQDALHTAGTALAAADLANLDQESLSRLLDHVATLLRGAAAEVVRQVHLPVPAVRQLVEDGQSASEDTLLA